MKFIATTLLSMMIAVVASTAFGKLGIVDDIVLRSTGKIIGYDTTAGNFFLNRGALKGVINSDQITALKMHATKEQTELIEVLIDADEGDIVSVNSNDLNDQQLIILDHVLQNHADRN